MEYHGIECFGYSADILSSRNDNPDAKLVCVSQKDQSGIELWVDRFDVQLLLDDPSVLWDTAVDESPGAEGCVQQSTEDAALEAMLNYERYRDLIPSSMLHHSAEASLLIPGPTKSSRLRHMGVPTAEEYSASHRALPPQGRDRSNAAAAEAPASSFPRSLLLSQSKCASDSPVPRPKSMFKPEVLGLKKAAMDAFMRDVKARQKSTGLPISAFWPATLETHLSIELTATLLNSLGPQAETELCEFITSVRDEDRIALGFVSKWHSLNPYYRLIRDSRYVHAEHAPLSIPVELRLLFPTEKSSDIQTHSAVEDNNEPVIPINVDGSSEKASCDDQRETVSAFTPCWNPPTENVSSMATRIVREFGTYAIHDRTTAQRCLDMLAEGTVLSFLQFNQAESDCLKDMLRKILALPDGTSPRTALLRTLPLHSTTQKLLRVVLQSTLLTTDVI